MTLATWSKSMTKFLIPCVFLTPVLADLGCQHDIGMENTVRVVRSIENLHRAESQYKVRNGRYGSLADLGPAGAKLVSANIAAGVANGYRLRVLLSESGYTITAWPVNDGKTGFRSYYCDQTGIVRGSWGPGLATATSPPLSEM